MKLYQSINNENNPVGNSQDFFIVHHTGSSAADKNQRDFLNKDDYISCHFSIDRDGKIFQLMDTERIAYHCGKSSWKGFEKNNFQAVNPKTGQKFSLSGMNPVSLGVEINSDGYSFTDAQRNSCEKLLAWWAFKFDKPVGNILRHADIAPGRKWDIGENFFKEKYGSWENFQKKIQFRVNAIKKYYSGVSEYIQIRYN